MDSLATTDSCRGSSCKLVDEVLSCENRRRRTEIRRLKLLANVGTYAEPVFKRSRPCQASLLSKNGLFLEGDADFVQKSLRRLDGVQGNKISRKDSLSLEAVEEGIIEDIFTTIKNDGLDVSLNNDSGVSFDEGTRNDSSKMADSEIIYVTVSTKVSDRLRDVASGKEAFPGLDHVGVEIKLNERDSSSKVVEASLVDGNSCDCLRAKNPCPPYGMLSVCGLRREMEDAATAMAHFLSVPCNRGITRNCFSSQGSDSGSPLHYFGVYDGHGGSQAALFCKDHLHRILADELKLVINQEQKPIITTDGPGGLSYEETWKKEWGEAIKASFLRTDVEVGGSCPRGDDCDKSEGCSSSCHDPVAPGAVGSTAVVALISNQDIVVANCGDSRAVLCRAGKAVPLSVDHKPEREDEMARVEAAGGRVINWGGYRVLGVLSMSRAIGDRFLKPYVIAEPEVTFTQRTDEDECLILASDGLWNVVSNELACESARKCLASAVRSKNGSEFECNTGGDDSDASPAGDAAALLTKMALAKGSNDNISVIVIDLKKSRGTLRL